MTKTELGKITAANVGRGGRDDGMFGVTFHLETVGGSVIDFWPLRNNNTVDKLWTYMNEAGVKNVCDFASVPIEAEYGSGGSGVLRSWRILTEVL